MSIGGDKRISDEEIERKKLAGKTLPKGWDISMTGKDFSSKPGNRPKVVRVEIPMFATGNAWREVSRLEEDGYTIKGVIEREWSHSSIVILERSD